MNNDSIEAIKMKIIVLSLIRDMIKEVPPNIVYRSLQHRDDLYAAMIEAGDELESMLDELIDQQMSEEGNEEMGAEVEEENKSINT